MSRYDQPDHADDPWKEVNGRLVKRRRGWREDRIFRLGINDFRNDESEGGIKCFLLESKLARDNKFMGVDFIYGKGMTAEAAMKEADVLIDAYF